MALELKDLTGLIDLPAEIDSPDKAKEYFSTNFVHKNLILEDETVKNELGTRVGSVLGEATAKTIKEFGFQKAEVEGKKIEEIVKMGAAKLKAENDELKKGNGEPDKKVKEWETKYNTLNTDFGVLKESLSTKEKEIERISAEKESTVKNYKIGYLLKDAKAKLKFKEGMTEAEKRGFDSVLSQDFKFDLDEKENPIIFDKDGNKLKNTKGTGFMELSEFMEVKAKELGVLKLNNSGGTPPKQFTPSNNGGQNNGRKIATPRVPQSAS